MTDFASTLSDAIRESVQTNRTVDITVHNDEELYAVIRKSDGYPDQNGGTLDVWGHTDDGCEWRLCVKIAY